MLRRDMPDSLAVGDVLTSIELCLESMISWKGDAAKPEGKRVERIASPRSNVRQGKRSGAKLNHHFPGRTHTSPYDVCKGSMRSCCRW